MLVVAVIAMVVVGPKELPKVLAGFGRWVAKGRAVAREFQDGVQSVIREAELEDLRVELPDPNKIFGENPITQGKSIAGGDQTIPEEEFIDDDTLAEMEAADAKTVETIRQITSDADKARAEAEAIEDPADEPDEEVETSDEDLKVELIEADVPSEDTKTAAEP